MLPAISLFLLPLLSHPHHIAMVVVLFPSPVALPLIQAIIPLQNLFPPVVLLVLYKGLRYVLCFVCSVVHLLLSLRRSIVSCGVSVEGAVSVSVECCHIDRWGRRTGSPQRICDPGCLPPVSRSVQTCSFDGCIVAHPPRADDGGPYCCSVISSCRAMGG